MFINGITNATFSSGTLTLTGVPPGTYSILADYHDGDSASTNLPAANVNYSWESNEDVLTGSFRVTSTQTVTFTVTNSSGVSFQVQKL